MTTTPGGPGLLLGGDDNLARRFPHWRQGQRDALSSIVRWYTGPNRFLCVSAPTGSGKSLLAAMVMNMGVGRSTILTATKGLQDQLTGDFESMGLVDIRGQNAYTCVVSEERPQVSVAEALCHMGKKCDVRDTQCSYYTRLTTAKRARYVVTNYAYYLAQTRHSDGIGGVDLLIMDEADQAMKSVESSLRTYIGRPEMDQAGLSDMFPNEDLGEWQNWLNWAGNAWLDASMADKEAKRQIKEYFDRGDRPPTSIIYHGRRMAGLASKLETIRGAVGEWVVEPYQTVSGMMVGWSFTPVWVDTYSRHYLYRDVRKVMLMSATLTPKVAGILGVDTEEMEWLDIPSYFPPHNTPIQHVSTIRVDYRATDVDMRAWVSRIDQVLDRRADRKGIVLPVSYKRCEFLKQNSRHTGRMIVHDRRSTGAAVEAFKRAGDGAVLVSPAVVRGWDFPGDQCRFVIVGKIPFPDGRGAVNKARAKSDPEFAGFDTMQTIVQEAGRGSRSEDDWCEVLVLDDHWGWFWHKNGKYAPRWFWERLKRKTDMVPPPLQGARGAG